MADIRDCYVEPCTSVGGHTQQIKTFTANFPSCLLHFANVEFVGHCYRAENQPANKLLFWSPSEGKRAVGGSFKTFPSMLQGDTSMNEIHRRGTHLWRLRVDGCHGRLMMMLRLNRIAKFPSDPHRLIYLTGLPNQQKNFRR